MYTSAHPPHTDKQMYSTTSWCWQ